MPNLRSHLQELAHHFADEVLTAIRGASLEELVSDAPRSTRARSSRARPRMAGTSAAAPTARRDRPGRLARRSPEAIAKTLAQVVALVKGKKDGVSSEQIQKSLRLDRREVPRVLSTGLAKKNLRKKGQKRATRYFAG
jgi:hypothetical protein